jgi:hypothetical protein
MEGNQSAGFSMPVFVAFRRVKERHSPGEDQTESKQRRFCCLFPPSTC